MNRSFADVVGAVVVFAVGVLVVAWAAGLFRDDTVVEPEPVDYVTIAAEAESDAGFALARPAELPAGWRATSARWEPGDRLWHLGMLTSDEEYVEVEQSDDPAVVAAANEADPTPAGTVDVRGTAWRRLVDEETGEVSLVYRSAESTTLVTGTASEATLTAFAASLPEDAVSQAGQ